MNYYLNDEGRCLVVDLRKESYDNKVRYEDVLDRYTSLEQESYEDDLYHIYIHDEGDWEEVKSLSIDLDEVDLDIFVSDVEDSDIELDDEDFII